MGASQESHKDGPSTRHVRFKEILVFEEDETWGLTLQDALSEGGYRVKLVLGVDDAVRIAREHSADLVLVSSLVGEQASETLLRELEGLRLPPPVLLVGPRKGAARWDCWRSLPFVAVVEQPFTLSEVVQTVGAVVGAPWEDLTGGDATSTEGVST